MPLLTPPKLDAAIQAATLTPLRDEAFYRSIDLHVVANLGVDVLDGTRAGRTGGRYNPPGSPPTCYLAGSQTLAAFECEQRSMILGIVSAPQNPRVTFAATVSNALVLDLTSAIVLAGFGLVQTELTQPASHWQHLNRTGHTAATQTLGAAARGRADCDGLLVPSWLGSLLPAGTLPRPINLVLFMDPIRSNRPSNSTASITIHDPTGLL